MNREDIRKKVLEFALNTEEVYIKEWKTKVTVKEITGEDLISLTENAMVNGVFSNSKFLTLAIIKSIYVEGDLLFTQEDYESVKTLPVSIYSTLVTVITKLNALESKSKN